MKVKYTKELLEKVCSDSFSYRQRKRAIKDKYNKEYVKKKAMKSREKHYKLKMKYR